MNLDVRRGRGLPRSCRLTKDREIREAYAQGRRWVGRTMVLWLRRGEGASLRLAVVSSKKVGNAVMRNSARRRLRDVYRISRHLFSGDVDVVLVARRKINRTSAEKVREELVWLAERAGLVKQETE